ncbi:hypothetical protein NM688_g7412 [Phlebia brevispora]|uniref:Uncharacterized protein n=1 Tax=Phlebia brevispora TaxID=194682 RepID=A0ACC1S5G0_9APHY|nr:hypothetical protein NM688_g7412 [Phlebia brevispora]
MLLSAREPADSQPIVPYDEPADDEHSDEMTFEPVVTPVEDKGFRMDDDGGEINLGSELLKDVLAEKPRPNEVSSSASGALAASATNGLLSGGALSAVGVSGLRRAVQTVLFSSPSYKIPCTVDSPTSNHLLYKSFFPARTLTTGYGPRARLNLLPVSTTIFSIADPVQIELCLTSPSYLAAIANLPSKSHAGAALLERMLEMTLGVNRGQDRTEGV